MADDYCDLLFRRAYAETLSLLAARAERGESLASIRGHLQTLYVASGLGWDGKGELWHVTTEASIAAYEAFLARCEESGRASD